MAPERRYGANALFSALLPAPLRQGTFMPVRHCRGQMLALGVLLLALIPSCSLWGQAIAAAAEDPEIRANLSTFTKVFEIIEQDYAEAVNPEEVMFQGAIPGMLRVLDPHSMFFDAKAFALLAEEQRGNYYGIGVQIERRGNQPLVVAPLASAPGYRAGLRPGDVILAVDGDPVMGRDPEKVLGKIKGPRGTTVKIAVRREGSMEPLTFIIMRDTIPAYSVDVHCVLEPGIGYVHVNRFSDTTAQEFAEALRSLGDLQGLILDLRDNPGGSVTEAVRVVDTFLPRGTLIVSQIGRTSAVTEYRATGNNAVRAYPVVVLVNRGTASAAEIVAGALQDHDRGLIVGERTFGKALVQTIYPLSEGTGIALTTGRYYTPSGRLLQRDYRGSSVHEYYFSIRTKTCSDVKRTDSGRPVCSGGGISPDITIKTPRSSRFQNALAQQNVFFNFTRHYLGSREGQHNVEVNESVLATFRVFLTTEKVPWTEVEFKEHLGWLKNKLKGELFTYTFGRLEGLRASAESDPQVREALRCLPKAQQLLESRPLAASR